MNGDPLLTVLGGVAVSMSLLLAAFLLLVDGPLKQANKFLAAFLLLTAIDLIGWTASILPDQIAGFLVFRLPLSWLQMPMLYAYAAALCGRQARRHVAGGLIAALLSALSLLPRIYDVSAVAWLDNRMGLLINSAGLHLQFYAYIGLLVVLLSSYRREYLRNHSNPDDLTVRWLGTLILVSAAAHTLVLLKSLALWSGREDILPGVETAVALSAVTITFALTLAALTRQKLFLGAPAVPQTAPSPGQAASRSADEDEMAIKRITLFMEGQEPFLDPSLTVRTLARRLGMGQRELSNLINDGLGKHFFDFVNAYRVDRASVLLANPETRNVSVLEIAHLSGFNSKSSFNAAFRKHKQETPTSFRQRSMAGAKAKIEH